MVTDHVLVDDAAHDEEMTLAIHDVFRSAAERDAELLRLRRVRAATLASVSHELRTPLTVISATADTVLGHTDDPLVAQMMQAQRSSAKRLSDLVNEILSVTTLLATDDRADDQATVSLTEAVATAVTALDAGDAKVEVTTDIASGADRIRTLPAILQTMLRCAIEDRWRSGDRAPIRVAVSLDVDTVQISVRSMRPVAVDRSQDVYSPQGGAGFSVMAAALLAERLGGSLTISESAEQMLLIALPQRREDDPIPRV